MVTALAVLFFAQHVAALSIMASYLAIHCSLNPGNPLVQQGIHNENISIWSYGDTISFESRIGGYQRQYKLNESTEEMLAAACAEDLSPVLDRMRQSNFSQYCDFYPAGFQGNISHLRTQVTTEQVGNWTLRCLASGQNTPGMAAWEYTVLALLFLVPVFVLPMALLFVFVMAPVPSAIALALFVSFLYHAKGRGVRVSGMYALPILLGTAGGIIGYISSKDKRFGIKLLVTGLVVSAISILFLLYFIAITLT